MTLRRNLLACLALFVVSTPALCEPATDDKQPSTEKLLAQPPDGWTLAYQMNKRKTRITDFLPPKETEEKWTSKLTFEAHADLAGSDTLQIAKYDAEDQRSLCRFLQDFNIFTGVENGYQTTTRLLLCGRNKFYGKGQVSLIKTIGGRDYMYIIRIVKFVPPFDLNKSKFNQQEMAAWSHYFGKITVCDTADPAHPCPKPANHPPDGGH